MSIPNQATIRYVTNLLLDGYNDVFAIEKVAEYPHIVAGDKVGWFYEVQVKLQSDFTIKQAYGPSPRTACKLALEKHGVSFT